MTHPVLARLHERARAARRRIVFPEAADPRVVLAATKLVGQGLAAPVLVSDALVAANRERYAALLHERRRHKGLTAAQAAEAARDPLLFAALMVAAGDADGCVGGSVATTAETVRAAILGIGPAQGVATVSSFFLMAFPSGASFVFTD